MISGNAVILRAPNDQDETILQEMRNDTELQAMLMSVARPNTTGRVREWLNRRLSDEQGLFFVIAEIESNSCAGFIQVTNINLLHGTGQLGIAVHPSFRGQGLGGEAITLCENYVQRQFRLRKIVLDVLASNEAARLYHRVGYETVGVHRQHFFSNGEYQDVLVMEKMLPSAINMNRDGSTIREAA